MKLDAAPAVGAEARRAATSAAATTSETRSSTVTVGPPDGVGHPRPSTAPAAEADVERPRGRHGTARKRHRRVGAEPSRRLEREPVAHARPGARGRSRRGSPRPRPARRGRRSSAAGARRRRPRRPGAARSRRPGRPAPTRASGADGDPSTEMRAQVDVGRRVDPGLPGSSTPATRPASRSRCACRYFSGVPGRSSTRRRGSPKTGLPASITAGKISRSIEISSLRRPTSERRRVEQVGPRVDVTRHARPPASRGRPSPDRRRRCRRGRRLARRRRGAARS